MHLRRQLPKDKKANDIFGAFIPLTLKSDQAFVVHATEFSRLQ